MARTIRTKVYKFNELSEEAKANALDHCREFNVTYDWWESLYEDADNIGLKITSFDLDRRRGAEGKFYLGAEDVIKAILEQHGTGCETYKTAEDFKNRLQIIKSQHSITEDGNLDDEITDWEYDFLKSILEDYSIMLQKESEYLTTDEAVKETIEANEYEFTKEGNRF